MRPLPLLVLVTVLCGGAFAGVVRVDVRERSDVALPAGASAAGAYERVVGEVHFAIDPKLPVNRAISDIEYAPRNARGLVEFRADVYLLQPKDAARGNGTVLLQVANRGRKDLLVIFNRGTASNDPRAPAEIGDGFLFDRGFTLAWIGWQYDIPSQDNLTRLAAPVARDGVRPITGIVRGDFVPDQRVTEMSVADRYHAPYPIANADDPNLRLTVRDQRDAPRTALPRDRWTIDATRTKIVMPTGFEPGKIYEIIYQARDPALVGLGFAAVRDFVSHLKQNRSANGIQRAIAIGSSQTGRFLRTYLYFGFNEDEKGAAVFDGVWSHVAGAGRGSFNHRFAQPSRDARPYYNFFYPTDLFPFTDAPQSDRLTGLTEGLLDRAEKAGTAPRIFYTNGSYEYYGRAASLIHTTVEGARDFPPRPGTRIYFVAGSQHGPATAFPPRRVDTQQLPNSNDYRWAMRSLLVAMQRWIAEGAEPPASVFPRIGDGQLVALHDVKFPKIPSVAFPKRIHDAFALDYGAEFRRRGVISIEPATMGPRYRVLLPQVDADGNEASGLRMPWLQVPLATYTGWNLRAPAIGAPEELFSFVGSTLPFAKTKDERTKSGDPRPSIAERYKTRDEYLDKIRASIRSLISGGYLLESDANAVAEHAGRQWDYWTN